MDLSCVVTIGAGMFCTGWEAVVMLGDSEFCTLAGHFCEMTEVCLIVGVHNNNIAT